MTLKPPGPQMEAPQRVKAIAEMAGAITVNPETHAKHYFRSGRELIRSAASYQEDGQTENAYILYLRFLTIFLDKDKLRQHPTYKDIPQNERKVMSEYCKKIIPQAEYLKGELLQKFEKEHEDYLVHLEKHRREMEAKEREAMAMRQKLPDPTNPTPVPKPRIPRTTTGPEPVPMPTFHPSAPLPDFYDNNQLFENKRNEEPQPQLQPYHPYPSSSTSSGPSGPSSGLGPMMPSVDRSTKPSRVLTPNYSGMRTLMIPVNLSETFLRYATSNTNRNVETCGLLTGKIRGQQLVITDLIIPKQSGSSDTCNMMNETEIFDLQDKFKLITLGWIHTHPSQTAFLSSIDLHTHYSYQVMMPEAIAIVCAPKHSQVGFFTLTPQGMEEIGRCNLAGFHPHPSTGIFTESSHYTLDGSDLKVHDLRS